MVTACDRQRIGCFPTLSAPLDQRVRNTCLLWDQMVGRDVEMDVVADFPTASRNVRPASPRGARLGSGKTTVWEAVIAIARGGDTGGVVVPTDGIEVRLSYAGLADLRRIAVAGELSNALPGTGRRPLGPLVSHLGSHRRRRSTERTTPPQPGASP